MKSPFGNKASTSCTTRPLTKEQSDANVKMNRLSKEAHDLETRLGAASIKSAEAQLESAKCHADLHRIRNDIANIRVGKPISEG